MRVLIVAEQLRRAVPGGIGTYVRGLVRGLAELENGPAVTAWASRGPDLGLGVAQVTTLLPGPAVTRLWDRGLLRAGRGHDIVHAASLATPPARRPIPMTVMVHDLAWRESPDAFPPRGRAWHERALHRAVARARVLVTPSQETARALVAAGVAATQVAVIEEGCDHLPQADDDGARRLLSRLGVTGGFLLTVGTIEPRKNLARLLRAYQAARPDLPDRWPLVVVGPQGWGAALPATDGVVLTGHVGAGVLSALYGSARAVAYVPLHEGFGLPAVEAMACGAPVVASPMPSTGGAALEVDPLDEDAIAAGLVAAASDDDRRRLLVAAGATRAGELTWRAAASRHVDVWKKICG